MVSKGSFIHVNLCDLFTCGPALGYTDPTPNCTACTKGIGLAFIYTGPLYSAPAGRDAGSLLLQGFSVDAASPSPP